MTKDIFQRQRKYLNLIILSTFFASHRNGALRQKKMIELRLEFNITNNKHQRLA